ncbi:YybH family protein [Winogradskyella aurantiaca]|uniref:YybH family protein n=1 Tax=Winogradskyella aurantiaca TaxID=2219558 RepID=UPI000E1C9B38|nr:nuclear transport factor 2 family protein [Winogradskyella aurantiaca]
MKKQLLIIWCISFLSFANGQNTSSEVLDEINLVWADFYRAFDSLDYTYMAKIHAEDLVRISGGARISDYDAYINSYKSNFQAITSRNETRHIELRFFERINNANIASERGVYQLSITDKEGNQSYFYGQFHVLFKKQYAQWKIIMDYDSSEGDTIDKTHFFDAKAIDDFSPFVNN